MNCRIGIFENVYIDGRHFLVALASKAWTSMWLWFGSLWEFGRYMLIQAKSVRSSAVLFHIVNVGPVRPPGKSFEREAGKANKACIFHSGYCPSQTRNCFGSFYAMCN